MHPKFTVLLPNVFERAEHVHGGRSILPDRPSVTTSWICMWRLV
ncbi:MAG: hypothetical protein V1917_02505 [Candidatus Gottesmanbacteria bacterium]